MFHFVLLLFEFVNIFAHQHGNCGELFKGKCWCGVTEYDRTEQFIVNCTNEGFSDTSILEHMPYDVEVLIFTGNFLSLLSRNIFGHINDYPKLKIIDMSNNHIREIHGKTYHHVQQVERLILNHNNLSLSSSDEANHIHPRIFSNFLNLRALHLTNAFSDYSSSELSQNLHTIFMKSNLTLLRKLHLEQNEIIRFKDHNVFCDLPNLEDLHLGDNNLKELNFNVICLHHLRFLDLERNKFEYLQLRDLKALEMLENSAVHSERLILDFSTNPFTCNCTNYEFAIWLRSTNVTIRDTSRLMCYQSYDHAERIDSHNFTKCATKLYSQVFLVFLLVVIISISVGLIGAILYVSKDRINNYVSPVLSSRKVHYTTIRDDDITQEVHV